MNTSPLPLRITPPPRFIEQGGFLGVIGPQLLEVDESVYALTRYELFFGRRMFVITELTTNEGVPLAMASERIATEVFRRFGSDILPEHAVFIEHYDPAFSFHSPATSACEKFFLWDISWEGRQAVFIHPKPVLKKGIH